MTQKSLIQFEYKIFQYKIYVKILCLENFLYNYHKRVHETFNHAFGDSFDLIEHIFLMIRSLKSSFGTAFVNNKKIELKTYHF